MAGCCEHCDELQGSIRGQNWLIHQHCEQMNVSRLSLRGRPAGGGMGGGVVPASNLRLYTLKMILCSKLPNHCSLSFISVRSVRCALRCFILNCTSSI